MGAVFRGGKTVGIVDAAMEKGPILLPVPKSWPGKTGQWYKW